jgi:hypothetical protein
MWLTVAGPRAEPGASQAEAQDMSVGQVERSCNGGNRARPAGQWFRQALQPSGLPGGDPVMVTGGG